MVATINVPANWVHAVSELRFSPGTDRRIAELMDKNNDGLLSTREREELADLVEMSERISLLRADALLILGKKPL